MSDESWSSAPYDRADWDFYKKLRDTDPSTGPKRLTLLAGARSQYYNHEGGDAPPQPLHEDVVQVPTLTIHADLDPLLLQHPGKGLHILAPTQQLVDAANNSGDYNDCSYVLLYRTKEHRIIFGGDSHDDTWEHILSRYEDDVRDIDLLMVAPHHGRDSGRSYEFLDVLRPSLTFFGNARSEHLAYDAWRNRDLLYVTNNQANCMVVDASQSPMNLYVTNEAFASRVNPSTCYDEVFQAWFAYAIER